MKRMIFPTLAMVVMAGCQTPSDLTRREPMEKFQVSKPAKDVAGCISQRWSASIPGGASVNTVIIEEGYMVSWMAHNGAALATAVITEKAGITTVTYYEPARLFPYAPMKDGVLACK